MAAKSPSLLAALLVLSAASLAVFAPSCMADNVMFSSQALKASHYLQYGSYILSMQADCDLVLYDGAAAVWSTGTSGNGINCQLQLQYDGDLVIYDGSSNSVWSSGTAGAKGNYVLVLQFDLNVVIYSGATWSTGTAKN